MGVQSVGGTKLDYARRTAAALAYMAIGQGDAVGLNCVADKIVQQIPPRRNPAHLSTIYDLMESVRATGQSALPSVLHELAETVRQRAMIMIFSDLFMPPQQLRDCFEHLRFRKHDVCAFHLLDPEELSFNFQRPTRFVDTEDDSYLYVDPVEIADRYLKAIGDYLTQLKQVMLETSVDYRRVMLSQPYDQMLRDFLVNRAHQARAR
jgi:uncharacterized protein (DUF58 family)